MFNAKKNAILLGLVAGLSIQISSGIAHADGLTATGNTLPIGTSAGTVLTISGSGTSGDASFTGTLEAAGQASVNSLAVTNEGSFGGPVGIGTTTPQAPLDVNGRIQAVNLVDISTDRLGSYQSDLELATQGTMPATPSTLGWQIYARGHSGPFGADADKLGFSFWNGTGWTNNTLVLTPSGNVGIGTTAPTATLDVENSSNDAQICLNGSCEVNIKPKLAETENLAVNTVSNPTSCLWGNSSVRFCSNKTTIKSHDLCVLGTTEVDGSNNNCLVHGVPGQTWTVEAQDLRGETNCEMDCYDFQ
jgi:hypothetical protein